MRHAHQATPQSHASVVNSARVTPAASVPPVLRQILNLPENPVTPPPRRPFQDRGRLPPGPPPPASWLSATPRSASVRESNESEEVPCVLHQDVSGDILRGCHHTILQIPEIPRIRALNFGQTSLMAMVIRQMAHTWPFQRSFNQYHLYRLPGILRSALVSMLSRHHVNKVSIQDLQVLFTMPEFPEAVEYWEEESTLNDDVHELDLSGCLGHTISLKELSVFLHGNSYGKCEAGPYASLKGKRKATNSKATEEEIQESWETASLSQSPVPLLSCVLPYLTHLALGLHPIDKQSNVAGASKVSWRQFLGLASKLSSVTYLSLAFWPTPTLYPGYTPDLPLFCASENNSNQTMQLADAIFVMRKLSKALYGLQYLDLTGCQEWWSILGCSVKAVSQDPSDPELGSTRGFSDNLGDSQSRIETEPRNPLWQIEPVQTDTSQELAIDWVGDWGKMETVVMKSWYNVQLDEGETRTTASAYASARDVERHVRGQRLGRGRLFTVEKDTFSRKAFQ